MTLHRGTISPDIRRSSRFVTDALDISLVGEDTYCLLGSDRTIGFVQKRGNVFVALLGEDFLHTADVGESLSFDTAVSIVVSAYRR